MIKYSRWLIVFGFFFACFLPSFYFATDADCQSTNASRDILIAKPYLHLPVRNNAPMRRMKYISDGKTLREFDIELADAQPDFWVFSDVSSLKGKTLKIAVDALPSDSQGLSSIIQSDEIPNVSALYREKYRPQFHFSSRRGWNNDPNGLVFYQGEYHLFYQHNPYGWKWGNMHWGHAVSPDLVHWRELPLALYPREYGDWCFSGSAVIDEQNTAGFQTGKDAVLIAAYTSTGRGECIAYSNDRGRTFTDYAGNPVVKHQGRDPKVIRYEPAKCWVMAVYDEIEKSRGVAFYTSADLKNWQRQSRIEGYFECPELFEIAVDGKANNKKWILYSGDGAYAVGSFDGKAFTPECEKQRFNYGNCFYASQTFSNIPTTDGRRIQIAWGTIGHPEMPFNQMMDFPVELTLHTTAEGLRLFAVPVKEIELLRTRVHRWENKSLKTDENCLTEISGDRFDIRVEFPVQGATALGFNVRGIPVIYDVVKQELSCQDKTAPMAPIHGVLHMQLLVDRMSIEIFADHGRIYMPMGVHFADENRTLEIFGKGENPTVNNLQVYELQSIWK